MKHASAPRTRRPLPLPDCDRLVEALDTALRTLFAEAHSTRPFPGETGSDAGLNAPARRRSAQLMRVNHSGEVSAQALYQGQLATARNERVRALLARAAREETEHLAWTSRRLSELGGAKSVLDPLWYSASFAIGALSGLFGDRWNLGFLAETERQVESHLEGHLKQLPAADERTRAILEQMKQDEARHAVAARQQGARALPLGLQRAMRVTSKLMTTTSLWV